MFDFMERMGSAVCHQMVERSFIFDGMQMPLCARCTGIYIGAFFAFCFFFLKKRMGNGRPFSIGQAFLTGLAVLPVGIDGVGSYLATERAIANKGYSATPYCNKVSPAGGQTLVNETLDVLNKLK